MNYLNIIDASQCTGCMACYNICPKKAIAMREGSDTFVYPYKDDQLCIHCDLCERACPILNTQFHQEQEYCYAITTKPEIQSNSSSGGAFTIIAEYVLRQGGVVCGVQFDKEWNPEHVIIDNMADLQKLRGSKYVQSNVGLVYREIKDILRRGRRVLFSGTPCQVAALYGVLGDKPDGLLTIDIACHGVPSQKIWQSYLRENYDVNRIQAINFRDKEKGWRCAETAITSVTAKGTKCKHFGTGYMDAFVKSLSLRSSCGNCKFAQSRRVSDMTLADYWGIWKEDPKMFNHLGVSLIIANSDNGKYVLEELREKFVTFAKEKFATAKMNYPLFRSSIHHENRALFLKEFTATHSFGLALKKSLNYVSVINFWWCNNYGAMCTAYALQETIKDLGYAVKTVNYIPKWFYSLRYRGGISEAFAKEHFDLTKLVHTKKELEQLNDECSIFVCGSDQIWRYGVEQLRNWKYFKDYENLCFLSYAHNDKKKIAYAASFACDSYEGPHRNRQFVKYLLHRFQHVSVRELDGVDICREEFGVNASCVLDPVFLRDAQFWSKIAEKSDLKSEGHICYYVLDTPDAKKYTLDYIGAKVGGTLVDISKGFNEPLENWLYYIKNCRLFVADSFHGCCFAIIFNRPFICLKNTFRGGSRFDSIFEILGLESRVLMNYENIEDRADLFEPIDYQIVNRKLEEAKKISLNWLSDALQDSSPISTSASDDMLEAAFSLLEDTINASSENTPSSIGIQNTNTGQYKDIVQSLAAAKSQIRLLFVASHLNFYWWKKVRYKIMSLTHRGEESQKYKQMSERYKLLIKQAQTMKKNLRNL